MKTDGGKNTTIIRKRKGNTNLIVQSAAGGAEQIPNKGLS